MVLVFVIVGVIMKGSLFLCLLLLSGCSVAMSANRSTYKGDPAMIQKGADKQVIESTFGPPNMTTSLPKGETKAIYKIDPNAHRAGSRGAAVAGHVVADVLTLGLWEAIGTPIELAAQDEFTNYVIVYGDDDKVKSVDIIK